MPRPTRAQLLAMIKELTHLASAHDPDHVLVREATKILLYEQDQQTRNKRMMKGTTTATVSETLCGNDPVNW